MLRIDNDAELILKLSSKTNGFLLLLDQQSIDQEMMCLILATLARASKSSTEQKTVQLLVHFYMEIIPKLTNKSNFNRELKLYITDLSDVCAIDAPYRKKNVEAIQNMLIFLHGLQLTIYQKSFDAVRDLMKLITAQIQFINRKGNTLNEFIVGTVDQINESVANFEQMKEKIEQIDILPEPPEDFRQISIYPDTSDILSDHGSFIRKNIVEGKYGSVNHYLDVQFRLLREDFVRPLRNGITQYRNIKSKPEEMAAVEYRINDLNIYKNVRIYKSKMLHNDQVHFCTFDSTPFRNLRWQVNDALNFFLKICKLIFNSVQITEFHYLVQ